MVTGRARASQPLQPVAVRLTRERGIDHDLVFERALDRRVGVGQPVVERGEIGLGIGVVAAAAERRRRDQQTGNEPFSAQYHR